MGEEVSWRPLSECSAKAIIVLIAQHCCPALLLFCSFPSLLRLCLNDSTS